MSIVLTGSIAYDYLMTFPGHFREQFLPDQLDRLSLSFLVDSMVKLRGGIAANIAYTLALLGERPMVMATVGEDFEDYRAWLDAKGVDTTSIRTIPGLFTASFFVTTDLGNAQIASFYTGAMARAADLRLADLPERPTLAVISANDPGAMQAYVRECRSLHIPYAYDPSQQVVRTDVATTLREGIEGCEALFGNDYEFGLIREKTGLSVADICRTAKFAAMTCGEAGVRVYTSSEEVAVPAIVPTDLVDPTGVGDAFRAGFLKGYLHGLSLERCAQMGVLAATYCLEAKGPQGHEFDLRGFTTRFREHFDDHAQLDRLS